MQWQIKNMFVTANAVFVLVGFRGMSIHNAKLGAGQSYTSKKYITYSDAFRFAAKCPVGSPKGNAACGRVPTCRKRFCSRNPISKR
ncbi:hypothetical protein BJP50_16170 [Paenibacillus odorifer]|nr:hypothetical protein BJP50_16170 [Paenibacillus odorifer]